MAGKKQAAGKKSATATGGSSAADATPTDLAAKKKHVRELAKAGRWQEVCCASVWRIRLRRRWNGSMVNVVGRCVLVLEQIKKQYGQKMVTKAKACKGVECSNWHCNCCLSISELIHGDE